MRPQTKRPILRLGWRTARLKKKVGERGGRAETSGKVKEGGNRIGSIDAPEFVIAALNAPAGAIRRRNDHCGAILGMSLYHLPGL